MEENFYLFKALADKQEMLGDTRIEYDRMKAEEAEILARLDETERDSTKRENEIKEKIASYARKSREVRPFLCPPPPLSLSLRFGNQWKHENINGIPFFQW